MVGEIVAGAAALAGSALSAAGAQKANKLGAKLTREGRDYDYRMWNLTNQYNSPVMQMQRLREAGLNPNLVYDKGATQIAALPAQSKVPEVRNTMANMDLTPMISMYQDWQVKKAQIDNLKKQGDLMEQDKILKALDVTTRGIKNDTGAFDLSMKKMLQKTQVDILGANLNKILNDIDLGRQRIQINHQMLPFDIGEKNARIQNLHQNTQNQKMEYDYQNNLRKQGIPIDAPWYVKTLFDWKENINKRVNGKYNNAQKWLYSY